jgi:hypothetical protein
VGRRWCDVTVETPDGKRHTITVQSESVYDAAIQFFSRAAASFPGDHQLPKTDKDTIFEVRPIYRVIQAQLMEWANKKANLYARIEEVSQVAMSTTLTLEWRVVRGPL